MHNRAPPLCFVNFQYVWCTTPLPKELSTVQKTPLGLKKMFPTIERVIGCRGVLDCLALFVVHSESLTISHVRSGSYSESPHSVLGNDVPLFVKGPKVKMNDLLSAMFNHLVESTL